MLKNLTLQLPDRNQLGTWNERTVEQSGNSRAGMLTEGWDRGIQITR